MEVSSGKLRRMEKKIVLIYDDQSTYCIGHGVLISPDGLILTAFHLFMSFSTSIGSKVLVKCKGGRGTKEFVAVIVQLDSKLDLALLQIEATNCKYARVAQEVRVGQGVHMIVSKDGNIFSYAGGNVAFERRPRKDIFHANDISFIAPETIFVQAHGLHGIPGCLGAPIFDSRGHIVGIYSTACVRMDLSVHVAHLKTFSQPFIQEEKGKEKKEKKEMKKKKRKIEDIDVECETSEAGEKRKRKKRN
ncbi:hypothetical protein OROHE_020503 [Orobanche hederae]